MIVETGQIFCVPADIGLEGSDLLDLLAMNEVEVIPAGCVMVFLTKTVTKNSIYFQLLRDVSVKRLKNAEIMYFEPGSLVAPNPSFVFHTPTFRFGNCRFPTKLEYNFYNNRCRL